MEEYDVNRIMNKELLKLLEALAEFICRLVRK